MYCLYCLYLWASFPDSHCLAPCGRAGCPGCKAARGQHHLYRLYFMYCCITSCACTAHLLQDGGELGIRLSAAKGTHVPLSVLLPLEPCFVDGPMWLTKRSKDEVGALAPYSIKFTGWAGCPALAPMTSACNRGAKHLSTAFPQLCCPCPCRTALHCAHMIATPTHVLH